MSSASHDFAHFRFLRDAAGEMLTLPTAGLGHRTLLALDCERWGLARLHIFEGAALRQERLEAFQAEMTRVAGLRGPSFAKILLWGRDDEELFYADDLIDAEPLPDYLARAGRTPLPMAAHMIHVLWNDLEAATALPDSPLSLRKLLTSHFKVVQDKLGLLGLRAGDYLAWEELDAAGIVPHLVRDLAQIFCSLISGIPLREFRPDLLPRYFEELPATLATETIRSLDPNSSDDGTGFRNALAEIAALAPEHTGSIAKPILPLRNWLARESSAPGEAPPKFVLPEVPEETGEIYGISARFRGVNAWIQAIPGPRFLPQEGWLQQHHEITRRAGRGFHQQLRITYLEDRDTVTLIGEERHDGPDLLTWRRTVGSLSLETVVELLSKVEQALTAGEAITGGGAIWWLTTSNILLGHAPGCSEMPTVETVTTGPIKLRLHQTSRSLQGGVNLPTSLRALAAQRGKAHLSARRGGVALPLGWALLTGEDFVWNAPIPEREDVPGLVRNLLETWRKQLSEAPGEFTEEVFLRLREAILNPSPEPLMVTDKPVLTESPKPEEVTLPWNPASLAWTETGPIACSSDDDRLDLEKVLAAKDSSLLRPRPWGEMSRPKPPRWPWTKVVLLAGLAALVLACAVGYELVNRPELTRLGRPAAQLACPVSAEIPWIDDIQSRLMPALEQWWIEHASDPTGLALLPALDQLEDETSRATVQEVLLGYAEKRDAVATGLLARLILTQDESSAEGLAWLTKAANYGDRESQLLYAAMAFSPVNPLPNEQTAALRLLTLAAQAGHAPAAESLASVQMDRGEEGEAVHWIGMAAAAGSVTARYQQGLWAAHGRGGVADPPSARAAFQEAAEQGHPQAMFWLGRCWELGFGGPSSPDEAKRWFRRSSDLVEAGESQIASGSDPDSGSDPR